MMFPMQDDFMHFCDNLNTQLREIIGRENYLIQKVGELHNHVTRLYALNHDITDIPPAAGHLELHQRACLRLAQMVAADLTQCGINYFLSAGSLLGAARTGDFIPWDDDIDFGLLRDDFNRAVNLLEQKYNHGYFHTAWAKSGGIFKVLFLNKVCLDLFPWDFLHKRIHTPEEIQAFKNEYNAAMDEARRFERGESHYCGYADIVNDMIRHGSAPNMEHGDIFEGIDWQLFPERVMGYYHNALWRHEYILPFGEIEFCGCKFMAPNNPDAWLTTRYGDWRALRPDFARHGTARFEWAELPYVHDFIKGRLK